MDALKIHHDHHGRTLTILFDDPQKEHFSEERGEEILIIKDRDGRVIGLGHLNHVPSSDPLEVERVEA